MCYILNYLHSKVISNGCKLLAASPNAVLIEISLRIKFFVILDRKKWGKKSYPESVKMPFFTFSYKLFYDLGGGEVAQLQHVQN
jgi:hypothetical protein